MATRQYITPYGVFCEQGTRKYITPYGEFAEDAGATSITVDLSTSPSTTIGDIVNPNVAIGGSNITVDLAASPSTAIASRVNPTVVGGTSTLTNATITWTDLATNEEGYEIEKSVNGGAWTAEATVGANVTSYVATDIDRFQLTQFRVRAYNAQGESDWVYSQIIGSTGNETVQIVTPSTAIASSVNPTIVAPVIFTPDVATAVASSIEPTVEVPAGQLFVIIENPSTAVTNVVAPEILESPTFMEEQEEILYIDRPRGFAPSPQVILFPNRRMRLLSGWVMDVTLETDVFSAPGYQPEDDQTVKVHSDAGDMPSPLVADTIYYIRDADYSAGTFKLATTKGGSAINITTQGADLVLRMG